MTADQVPREAVEMAWSMYLATHSDVDIADQRLLAVAVPLGAIERWRN